MNSIPRQLSTFLGIGILQYLIDVITFILLFSLFGMPIFFNIFSRAVAAIAGYYLNGRFTFQVGTSISSRSRQLRFVTLWILMTLLSSFAIAGVRFISEDQAWPKLIIAYSKPIIEIALFLLSFTVQKLWVFNRRDENG